MNLSNIIYQFHSVSNKITSLKFIPKSWFPIKRALSQFFWYPRKRRLNSMQSILCNSEQVFFHLNNGIWISFAFELYKVLKIYLTNYHSHPIHRKTIMITILIRERTLANLNIIYQFRSNLSKLKKVRKWTGHIQTGYLNRRVEVINILQLYVGKFWNKLIEMVQFTILGIYIANWFFAINISSFFS